MSENFYVYIGQLKKEFAKTKKAKRKNTNPDPEKCGLYVGYSIKPPKERWNQHLTKARNSKGKLFSSVAAKWGENYLHWKKFNNHNPLSTKDEAKKLEKKLALKYRDKRFAVWSDALPYIDKK